MPWKVACIVFCMFCAWFAATGATGGRQGRRQGASAMWRGAGAWRRPSRAMAPVAATVAATVAAKGARVAATVAAWSRGRWSRLLTRLCRRRGFVAVINVHSAASYLVLLPYLSAAPASALYRCDLR